MLNAVVPTTFGGLVNYRRSLRKQPGREEDSVQDVSPHFLSEWRKHARLIRTLRELKTTEARQAYLVLHYSQAYAIPGKTVGEKYQTIVSYVSKAWSMVREVTDKYVPELLRAPLTRDGRADSMNDPLELLFCAAEPPPKRKRRRNSATEGDRLKSIRAFKVRRTLVLAHELMTLGFGVAKIERVNEAERVLIERLEDRFFVKGLQSRVEVRAAIDPRTGECLGILGPGDGICVGMRLRVIPFIVRYFRHRGRLVPVFFDPDKKTFPSLLLKMIARGKRDPLSIPDVVRFLMVCRNRRELAACVERLQCDVFPVGGTSHGYFSNRRALQSARSSSSSDDHVFDKEDHVILLPDGTRYPIEGQTMLLVDWIQAAIPEFSGSHARFKHHQVRRPLEVLFPREVFGIDWESSENLDLLGV